jgi:hypothetical protein
MENRVFFPQAALDQWIMDGTVELQDGELTIPGERRRFRLAEAVRILREVSGAGDGHELLGRVKTRAYLEQLGAEIIETSMLVGDAAYDVEPGWMGVPIGTFAGHRASGSIALGGGKSSGGAGEASSDEEILARLVAGQL